MARNHFIPGPGASGLPVEAETVLDNAHGLRWMLFSVLSSSAMTIAARYASWELDSRLVVLYRAGLTLLAVAVALMIWPALRHRLKVTRWRDHLMRGLLIAISTHLGYYTIANVPLATTTVLFFTAPIFATVLAVMLHGETIGPRRMAAIAAGFSGALIILRPGFDAIEIGLITAILSSLTFALALNMSRNLSRADGPLSVYVSSMVFTMLLSIPIAAPVMAMPDLPMTWIALIAITITGSLRGVADIQAYRYAEAALLAPVTYLRLVFIGLGGFFLFDETVDIYTAIGAIIIIGATLYITRREAAQRRKTA